MFKAARIAETLEQVRRQGPLVHNVTNLVAMTLSANVLIAVGASPIMSAAPEEAGDLAAISGALVVNMGTLTRDWIEGAHAAAAGARRAGRARGSSTRSAWAPRAFRTRDRRPPGGAAAAHHPRQRLGDPALAGGGAGGKGVDSTLGTDAVAGGRAALARSQPRRRRGHRRGRPGRPTASATSASPTATRC